MAMHTYTHTLITDTHIRCVHTEFFFFQTYAKYYTFAGCVHTFFFILMSIMHIHVLEPTSGTVYGSK